MLFVLKKKVKIKFIHIHTHTHLHMEQLSVKTNRRLAKRLLYNP